MHTQVEREKPPPCPNLPPPQKTHTQKHMQQKEVQVQSCSVLHTAPGRLGGKLYANVAKGILSITDKTQPFQASFMVRMLAPHSLPMPDWHCHVFIYQNSTSFFIRIPHR